MKRRNWTREELILVFNLYCKTPFGKLHKSNPDVIELSNIIDRSENSISWKLVNFASFDTELTKRGIKGATNASKLDREIWDEFTNNWEDLIYESESLLEKLSGRTFENEEMNDKIGLEKKRLIKTRINQAFFRTTLLAAYDNTCCITGINNPDLLIAGHIIPWSFDKKNRLNPRNGLLLNALHDRAFEKGYIGINHKYEIIVCNEFLNSKESFNQTYFSTYHKRKINMPSKFYPDKQFLEEHHNEKFIG